MATIYRACYCTREQVMRALDVKAAAYNAEQIDRNLMSGSDSVDEQMARTFTPLDMTKKFDWPNYQYTYPWKLYFDQSGDYADLISIAANGFVSGTDLAIPVVIPATDYILQPYNSGPPFTRVELRRDLNSTFGNNTTPQQDIGITGTWGYWLKTRSGGTLAAAMSDTTTGALQSDASSGVNFGVGDLIIVDSERMIVTDAQFLSLGVSPSAGCQTASAADNSMTVPSGPAFSVGESILEDSEEMLIQFIVGNVLTVKRAWNGTVLSTHSNTTLSARRQISVIRGAQGTAAATHLDGAAISTLVIPGLVNELSVAESIVGLTQEPAAYSALVVVNYQGSHGITGGQQKEAVSGPGLADLRERCAARYARQIRSRVI